MFHICLQCSALFVPQNKRGRPSAFCSDRCQNRHYYERRVVKNGRPCTSCGKPMQVTRTSARDGQSRCQPCRRAAWGLQPHESVHEARAAGRISTATRRDPCHRCGGVVPSGGRRWKYCSDDCFDAARATRGHGFSRTKASAAARGYGTEHQRLRAALLPTAYGKPCHLCGEVMEEGDDLHLDHTEDRTGYRGFAHAICNYRDGARRARQKQRERILREGWRPGQEASSRRRPALPAA